MALKLTTFIPSSLPTQASKLLVLLSFQYILTLLLPPTYAFLLTIAFLLGTYLAALPTRKPASPALNPEDYVKNVKMGRWTAQPGLVGSEDVGEKGTKKLAQEGVVCFVLAASSNHPLGAKAPGLENVGKYFGEMWKEAEMRREEWGYLGRSTGLLAQTPTSITRAVLSYWKTVDGLHAFAHGPAHREGWDWWNRHKYPYIGIMHEVYAAPPGAWENISVNFVPFGMGQTQSTVKTANGTELKSTLMEASQKEWRSMLGRMHREVE